MNEFCRIAYHKYVSNEPSKKEIKKIIPFITVSRRTRYLGIKVVKAVKTGTREATKSIAEGSERNLNE